MFWTQYLGMSQNEGAFPGCLSRGMIRGYDSGYDSWVWFVGMIREPWLSVSPHISCMAIYIIIRTLNPKMFHMLVIIPYMERFGAGMLLPLCMLLSGWCVRFGAGMLVPLECRCKVLVEGAACCQSGVYSLERACWWPSGCCCKFCLRVVL